MPNRQVCYIGEADYDDYGAIIISCNSPIPRPNPFDVSFPVSSSPHPSGITNDIIRSEASYISEIESSGMNGFLSEWTDTVSILRVLLNR